MSRSGGSVCLKVGVRSWARYYHVPQRLYRGGCLRYFVLLYCLSLAFLFNETALAQQRPLLTEDPRLIPTGAVDVETGVTYERDARFTISGLSGSHVALLPTGLNFGL